MTSADDNHSYVKILFRLEKDEDGYPPDERESLWAFEVGSGLYSIDNVTFFARGVSWRDVVEVDEFDGELHFKRIVRPSGHSVLRIMVSDATRTARIHEQLKEMGADTEQSHIPGLLAVDVPPTTDLQKLREFLNDAEARDELDYEEASIAHSPDNPSSS